jgi:dihydrolipoamide dehydrogenase
MEQYDVAVIGGGPGGYVAAIRCAQLGLKTVCVDAWETAGTPRLGGTCLNVGCIPSKALLEASERYEHTLKHLAGEGIRVQGVALDLDTMQGRKDKIVAQLAGGVEGLLKKHKVKRLFGRGRLLSGNVIEVTGKAGAEQLSARQVILAVGSVPIELPMAKFDQEMVVDNSGALAFSEVPRRLVIIGAGVIGLELGSVWRRLGAEVTVLDAAEHLLATADADVAKEAARQFKAQGLDIRLGVKVEGAKVADGQVEVRFTANGQAELMAADRVVVAVGRRPNTAGIADASVGLKLDGRGFIEVDAHCRTHVANVWAIGDCVRGPMLAHKASEEGVMVAECIAGQAGHVNYDAIPWVIYTHPEIAWVGATEAALQAAGVAYQVGRFPFAANGRALSLGQGQGFVKLLADTNTDRLLGMHAIGPHASELIAQGVIAMEFGGSSEDLARICAAHPTLSEAVHEAALGVDGRSVHF